MHELTRKVEAKLKCTEYYLAYTALAVSEQLRSQTPIFDLLPTNHELLKSRSSPGPR